VLFLQEATSAQEPFCVLCALFRQAANSTHSPFCVL
jgi:hypothetical protein